MAQPHQLKLKGVEEGQWQRNQWRNGKVQCYHFYAVCSAWDEHVDVYGVRVYLVGVVVFIRHHFGRNAPRDVVSALHREMVETSCQFFPPSSQQVSEAMQEVVKERRMTWFSFARYLLRSKGTRPFVFEIPKYTGGESGEGNCVYIPVTLF